VKLVLFSDLHLDAPFRWARPEVARRRRQALRDALQRIVRLTQEVGADALLCGGDLYEHDRFAADTGAFMRRIFADVQPRRVYLAPGNHDWFGPASLYRRVDWTPNVHVFTSDRLEAVTLADGLTLWGGAHRAPANSEGFLAGFEPDRGGIHLALFHGSERTWLAQQESGKVPHAPFDAQEIERAGLHHVFLGHYHRPRDAERHTYPGNPEPLEFGEDGNRAAVVATIAADGSVRRERHGVSATAVHDLEVDVSGCTHLDEARERVDAALGGLSGLARLTLAGELAAEIDLRPSDFDRSAPWMDAVVVRAGSIRPAYDLDSIAQQATVRGEFVREVLHADLPEEERRRILITGLRALDGRDDLEVS
jgi:exonuclease SbcD